MVVGRAERRDQGRLGPGRDPVEDVHLVAALAAEQGGEHADRARPGDERYPAGPRFRGGAQDQPVDLLPGLGHDAARLGEHAQVAELIRESDREPRADPPAGGAVPVQALDPALGVAAVHAEVRPTGRAGRAGHRVRAADHPGHQVAGLDRRVRGRLEDPAEGFVPDDQPRPAGRRLPAAAQDFRVGPADAGQQPFNQDRALSWRRIGQLGDQLRAEVARDHAHRLHVSELIQKVASVQARRPAHGYGRPAAHSDGRERTPGGRARWRSSAPFPRGPPSPTFRAIS